MADICLADTQIKSGLIGQNVCQGSALHLSCIGVDYNDGEDYDDNDESNDRNNCVQLCDYPCCYHNN